MEPIEKSWRDIGDQLPVMATTDELSRILRIPAATLQYWRNKGTGPDYVKMGRVVHYPRTAVVTWIMRNTVSQAKAKEATAAVASADGTGNVEVGQ